MANIFRWASNESDSADLDRFLQRHIALFAWLLAGLFTGVFVVAAMNALGVERAQDKQLLAILELGNDHCSADGVQMITGCTFGKGNITKLGYGKFGLTLVDCTTGRAVRVVPRTEAQNATMQTPFFTGYRLKGVPPSQVPDEIVDRLIQKVLNTPQETILVVGKEFRVGVPKSCESFASFVCDNCGETVVEKYGRVIGSQKLCIPCQDKASVEERSRKPHTLDGGQGASRPE